MKRKSSAILWIIVVCVIIALGYLAFRMRPAASNVSRSSNTETAATSTASDTASSIFLSTDLGIGFQYGPVANAETSGTKVYVFQKGSEPSSGQSVEVFAKNPKESLEDSIRRQILAGYSSDCSIEIDQTNKYEGGYMTAEIVAPTSTDPNAPLWANSAECNAAYAQTNGLRYFLYDTNHPDMFAFVDIGQYAILSGEGEEPWQDTIRFIK